MNKMLYLIRGLPGSGKSTLAKTLAASLGCGHYEADMIFMVDGEYRFNADLLGHAHHWCRSKVEQNMSQEEHAIVVSNTFTTEKEMKPYLALAEEFGYNVTSMVIENRHFSGSIHDVPSETMQKMRDRFSIKL